jgi:hypothetical protein
MKLRIAFDNGASLCRFHAFVFPEACRASKRIATLDMRSAVFDHIGSVPARIGWSLPAFIARASTSPVRPQSSLLWVAPSLRLGQCLAAFVMALACAGIAEARSTLILGSESVSTDSEAHAKHCGCGKKCRGASCCCGSGRSETRSSTRPATASEGFASNPCQWKSAPCGDPIAPVSAPVGSFDKAAAMVEDSLSPPRDDGRRLIALASPLSTDRRANRLDRPPRFIAFA